MAICPDAPYFIILLCLMPDNFTRRECYGIAREGTGGDESPPVVSKANFEIFLNLLRKLGGGGGCCHYKRLNCFLYVLIALRNLFNSKRPSLYKTGRLHAYS